MIKRDYYLNKLISNMNNGFPKVITGLRRCGKSYLLNDIFTDYLINKRNITKSNILSISLDDFRNNDLRDPINLGNYVRSWAKDKNDCYVILDEIQKVYEIVNPSLTNGKHVLATKNDKETVSFVDVVLGLSREKNIDLYVTSSNSKMLSKDIATEFRDKAITIHLTPLSIVELYENNPNQDFQTLLNDYYIYGGMPLVQLKNSEEEKKEYLINLFKTTYIKDILDRNDFKKMYALDDILNIISDNTGSLINTRKISNVFESVTKETINIATIQKFIDQLEDAYLISEAKRFDIKGNSEIGSSKKYYFTDIGLRNARVNFAYPDYGHLMENIIFNELTKHGYTVNIGCFDILETNKDHVRTRKTLEVDFKATKGMKRFYIQVCDDYNSYNKERENKPFKHINDQYTKVIVVNKDIKECLDENGFTVIGIKDFLLNYI